MATVATAPTAPPLATAEETLPDASLGEDSDAVETKTAVAVTAASDEAEDSFDTSSDVSTQAALVTTDDELDDLNNEEDMSLAKSNDEEDKTVSLEDSEDEQTQSIELSDRPELTDEQKLKQEEVLAKSMELNDAFMALENMRKANLEVEFGGKAIPNVGLFHQYCSTCLHEQKKRRDAFLKTGDYTARRKKLNNLLARIKSRRRHPLCLVCTSPVCAKHSCKDFRKEKITVCGHCAPLFTMDFVVDAYSHDDEARRHQCMTHMIDSYDRALLMLRYSSQFIDEIADALETNSRKNDHIGLGSSMIGLTSGFTGVAAVAAQFVAAAAILSPAGPPLLMASILFGASAAAASTGTEAFTYYSQPNQLANKILALHDLVHSLLGVTTVLRDCINKGHVDAKHYIDMQTGKRTVAYWKSRLPPPPVPVPEETEATSAEDDDDVEELVVEEKQAAEVEEKNVEGANAAAEAVKAEENPQVTDATNTEEERAAADSAVEETKKVPSLADIDDDDDEAVVIEPAEAKAPEKKVPSLADIDDDDDEVVAAEPAGVAALETPAVTEADAQVNTQETKEKEVQTVVTSENEEGESSDGAVAAKTVQDLDDETDAKEAKSGEAAVASAAMVISKDSNVETDEKEDDDASIDLVKEEGTPKRGRSKSPQPGKSTQVVAAPSNMRCAMSRATTNAMKLAQFASVACVMLSFTTIILEAKNLKDTLKSLKAGSPCEKAQKLRAIKKEIDMLPPTKEIAHECEAYIKSQANKKSKEEEEK